MDLTEVLPDDALANILGRLPPRDLAASRCVRTAWRAVVDDHGLLLPHLLPHMVRGLFVVSRKGLFVSCNGHRRPSFFARPSAQQPTMIDGKLDFLPRYGGVSRLIVDHCNGLLLYRDFKTLCVVNPATRRWDDLPWEEDGCSAYLAFDPAVSLHYEVFSIPSDPEKVVANPPSLWTFNVFSSSTEQWHERSFAREAGAMLETPTNVRPDPADPRSMSEGTWSGCSVYWRGSLYVNFRGLFLVRLSLSDGMYRVIETPPIDIGECKEGLPYVGKSEKGVYFALAATATMSDTHVLRVWILVESSERIDWVLKHHIDLKHFTAVPVQLSRRHFLVGCKTWILDGDGNDGDGNNNGMIMPENLEWDSDEDNVVSQDSYGSFYNLGYGSFSNYLCFLGFHPYKEVVFLGLAFNGAVGVAYHLNSSKIQYLGRLYPRDDYSSDVYESFPYTPCMIGHLLKHGS